MAGRQSYEVTHALRWLRNPLENIDAIRIKAAAKKFGVSESTLYRAIGKQASNSKQRKG